MNIEDANPFRPTVESIAAPARRYHTYKKLPFVSGAIYATLCLGNLFALEYLEPVLPPILFLFLIEATAPFNIAVMVIISIGRNGIIECPIVGWIAAFLFATAIHYSLALTRGSKRG